MNRWPRLARFLRTDLLEVAKAMDSGEWWKDDIQQRADDLLPNQDPGYW